MGSKSRSSSSQSSTSQQFTTVNDGEFAGANGITIDESDHSINDSYNTETNTDIDYEQDNSIEDSYNTETNTEIDYEQDNSIEDSYNTDIELDGDYNNNTGVINLTDGGIIEEGFEFGKNALNANEQVSSMALRLGGQLFGDAVRFGSKALDTVEDTFDEATRFGRDSLNFGRDAFKEATAFGRDSLDFGRDAITAIDRQADRTTDAIFDLAESQTERFADSLEELTLNNADMINGLAGDLFAQNSAQSAEQLATVTELARNTALQGQDIVAKSANEQVKYMMFAVAGVAALGIFLTMKKG